MNVGCNGDQAITSEPMNFCSQAFEQEDTALTRPLPNARHGAASYKSRKCHKNTRWCPHYTKGGTASLSESLKSRDPTLSVNRAAQCSVERTSIRGRAIESIAISSGISAKEKMRRACYLQKLECQIDNLDQLNDLLENRNASFGYIFRHTKPELISQLVDKKFINSDNIFLDDIPEEALTQEMVLGFIESRRVAYNEIPDRFKNKAIQIALIELKDYRVLKYLDDLQGLDLDFEAIVRENPENLKYVPQDQQTEWMCRKALVKHPEIIDHVSPELDCFGDLCLEVMKNPLCHQFIPVDKLPREAAEQAWEMTRNLRLIPAECRTIERCQEALKQPRCRLDCIPEEHYRISPDTLSLAMIYPESLPFIPDDLKTEHFCRQFLEMHPDSLVNMPQYFIDKYSGWFAERTMDYPGLMERLPEAVKTAAFCRKFLTKYPFWLKDIPEELLESNPELLIPAARKGTLPKKLALLTPEALNAYAYRTSLFRRIDDKIKPLLPRQAMLFHCPWLLPELDREEILVTGDTPAWSKEGAGSPYMSRELLLSRYSPFNDTIEESGIYLKRRLLEKGSFQLRNKRLGDELQGYIQKHHQERLARLRAGHITMLTALPDNREVYGGRTFLSVDSDNDCCRRFKFLRKNEPLEEFTREEAMHRFASVHANELRLRSEQPLAVGLKVLAVDKMPAELLEYALDVSFSSELEVITINNKPYFLVYEFTTRDRQYSKLAHQRDEQGETNSAEQGLLNACYDLGKWASLGVVFTSTIQAYHSFYHNQRELFLTCMLSNQLSHPGAMTDPYNRATDQSDWGYTGLRDWGDCEHYPAITTYQNAPDATDQLPGYDQRVAFLNNFFENIVAMLMHYARLHREETGYNYQNDKCLDELARFVESGVNAYLSSLLGEPSTMMQFFETEAIYRQWLERMAKETVMWTETQDLEKDCYASHLGRSGCYPLSVYPDGKQYSVNHKYPDDFTSNGCDNLGNNHHKFPLTLLTRGLYQVCSGLADKLRQSREGASLPDCCQKQFEFP